MNTKRLAFFKADTVAGRRFSASFIYVAMAFWVLVCAFPFLWTFLTSVKETKDAFANPPVWLFRPTFEHYGTLWLEEGFTYFFINSMIVTVGTVVISISIGCLAGYALARYSGRLGFWLLFFALIFRAPAAYGVCHPLLLYFPHHGHV